MSKKGFSSSSTSLMPQNSNKFFYKIVDGQRNRCHNDYKLNAVVCVKDDEANNNNHSTSSLQSSPVSPSNYSHIAPSNTGSGKSPDSNNRLA